MTDVNIDYTAHQINSSWLLVLLAARVITLSHIDTHLLEILFMTKLLLEYYNNK